MWTWRESYVWDKNRINEILIQLNKAEDLLPFPVVAKDITLKKNQFIKEIEVDTDVILEVFDNEHDFMFSEVSCFPACEGICRKVLNDIKKEYDGMSIDALKIYYEEDRVKGGYSVKNIIELGELLKSLEEWNS